MRFLFATALLGLAATTASAQNPAPAAAEVHTGQVLRDTSGGRVGPVAEVFKDGSIQVIYNSQLVTVPASTLSVVDGVLKTSLTRKQLSQ